MYSKADVEILCSQWALGLKKRWGQNFLIHKQTAQGVVSLALSLVEQGATPCVAWELGPGLGALTRVFLEHKCVKNVRVFEIDHGICRALESLFAHHIAQGRLHIEAGDAQHTLPALEKEPQTPQLICGNLPYSVGVRLLLAIVQKPRLHVPLCVMLQKEAAERIAAPCGSKTYGVSSVVLQGVYQVQLERTVARAFFYPYAHVDSAVCVMRPRGDVLLTSAYMQALTNLARAAFSLRRKKLANTLVPYVRSTYGTEEPVYKAGIDPADRAEAVSVEHYSALAWECVNVRM